MEKTHALWNVDVSGRKKRRNFMSVQNQIKIMQGDLSVRTMYGNPKTANEKNLEDEYFVEVSHE